MLFAFVHPAHKRLMRCEMGTRLLIRLLGWRGFALAWWVAFILAVLIGLKAYDEYRFVQAHQRAMEFLGEP